MHATSARAREPVEAPTPPSARKVCKRFEVLDEGDGDVNGGQGLVFDAKSGLTWSRFAWYQVSPLTQGRAAEYCASRNMRLATKEELLGVTKPRICAAAWPSFWFSWSATPAGEGKHWVVSHRGEPARMVSSASYQVLCVADRAPPGDAPGNVW